MNIAEQLRQEGREEGEQTAGVEFLGRLLAQRFGPLDERVQGLLDGSSSDDRVAWANRVLTAVTVHEVFGSAWDDATKHHEQPSLPTT